MSDNQEVVQVPEPLVKKKRVYAKKIVDTELLEETKRLNKLKAEGRFLPGKIIQDYKDRDIQEIAKQLLNMVVDKVDTMSEKKGGSKKKGGRYDSEEEEPAAEEQSEEEEEPRTIRRIGRKRRITREQALEEFEEALDEQFPPTPRREVVAPKQDFKRGAEIVRKPTRLYKEPPRPASPPPMTEMQIRYSGL